MKRAQRVLPLASLFLTLAACGKGGSSVPIGSLVARAVDAPAGSSQRGVIRCDRNGLGCAPIAAGDKLAWDTQIKTTRGTHATFELDDGAMLDLGDDAAVVLTAGEGAERMVQVDRGTVALDTASTHAGRGTISMRLVDRVAEIDASSTNSVSARASGADRALLTVRRGTARFRGTSADPKAKGQSIEAGQTATVALGEALDERAAWSTAPVEAAATRVLASLAAPAPKTNEAPPPPAETTEAPVQKPIAARGLGAMTARVPGTEQVVSGVRLVAHRAEVTIRDGFARTEVEEEFQNDTARTLEGRYAFPLPPDATIARLALWVGSTLMEGEIVERERAARIFKGIVDDTVRPRDPALLEWVSGGEFALKVFPIPPNGSRKVLIAYDQALSAAGGRVRYVYPLSLGTDRSVTVGDFRVHVIATDSTARLSDVDTPRYAATIGAEDHGVDVGFSARGFTPDEDFVVSYQREGKGADTRASQAQATAYVPAKGEYEKTGTAADSSDGPGAFTAIRMTVDLPDGAAMPSHLKRERVIVIDTSFSQGVETLAGEVEVATGLLKDLDPNERFAVLACDTACAAYPEDGLAEVSATSIASAQTWLHEKKPAGASNIAGALMDAAARLRTSASGQLIYVGDGAASAGELSADSIASRVRPAVDTKGIDLRLLGAGRSVDEVTMRGLARNLGGAYERVATGDSLSSRISSIATSLRKPVIRDARVELPPSIQAVYPKSLPNLRVGEELLVVGKLARTDANATITLRGKLAGQDVALTRKVVFAGELGADNPLVPKLWASARIAELETSAAKDSADEVIALSKRYHVMSRLTSLLVLENDAMYDAFGIKRTTKKAEDQSDKRFASRTDVHDVPEDVASFGMIGLLNSGSDPNAPAAPWGRDDSLGTDPLSARGNMWGRDIGESFGAGGLGLSGIGEGGGGRGEGIGLGSIGTIGHGSSGFGSGQGRLGGSHKTAPPRVRMGATSVSGRLPPEVIQRIVRQNFGRFRLCYENGLRNNPNLQGRVSVRFIIGADGAVSNAGNGGSDLPDAGVVSCVVRAFFGLSFPSPEGGIVTVTYPIMFSPGDDGPARPWQSQTFPRDWWPTEPSASHQKGDGKWMTDGEAELNKLRSDLAAASDSRSKREALVRGLLARGRFEAARDEAARFVALDPDLPAARELLAFAEATNGDAKASLASIDALVETSPKSHAAHVRAARAFEASGDEKRACAHWRSASELRTSQAADDTTYEAIRCRARADGDRDGALAEARAIDKPSALVKKLLEKLESGSPDAYSADATSAGSMEASMTCTTGVATCPTVVIVTPNGTVLSPWTPATARSSANAVAAPSVRAGIYRTLLVGGSQDARGVLTVRALGATRKFTIEHGGLQTVASTLVTGA